MFFLGKKRDKLDITIDILKALSDKMGRLKKTRLLYKANLSHSLLNRFLDALEKEGSLYVEKKGSNIFVNLTEEGYKKLHELQKVNKLKNNFGLWIIVIMYKTLTLCGLLMS